MNLVALVVALGSFVISVAALYATALKKAHIGIHYTRLPGEWHVASWTGLVPSGEAFVILAVYAHNSGANAGILETVTMTSESTLGGVFSQPVVWQAPKTALDTSPGNERARFPRGIDAGEIEELYLVGNLHLSLSQVIRLVADEQADVEREETFARQLFDAGSLPVTVRWRYARPGGFLKPGSPEAVEESTVVQLATDGLRETFVRKWQFYAEHDHFGPRAKRLIEIATTGTAAILQSPDRPD